jgi:hypothetical protein
MADSGRTSEQPKGDRCREVVRHVAKHADRPLTATELRQLALRRDRSLEPVAVALAIVDLKNRGEIRVAH